MKPLILGSLMAGIMLLMLHDPIMTGQLTGTVATLAFVGAHLLIAGILLGVLLFLPRFRAKVVAHRPSPRHAFLMLVGLVGTASLAHLFMHGGVA